MNEENEKISKKMIIYRKKIERKENEEKWDGILIRMKKERMKDIGKNVEKLRKIEILDGERRRDEKDIIDIKRFKRGW